jgi:hypothetical protein
MRAFGASLDAVGLHRPAPDLCTENIEYKQRICIGAHFLINAPGATRLPGYIPRNH